MSEAAARAREVLSRLGPGAIGAEIGVAIGQMSEALLRAGVVRLYMIDSWAAEADQPESYRQSGDWHARCTQPEQDAHYRAALEATDFAGDRRIVIRLPSVEAAKAIEDASLDFCFIDADHSYEGVKADIAAWRTKVKPGGWLCGHDYYPQEHQTAPWMVGVRQAVDEAAREYGWTVTLGDNWTWFARI